jgi:hypothetical protein
MHLGAAHTYKGKKCTEREREGERDMNPVDGVGDVSNKLINVFKKKTRAESLTDW